jgi:hypothetical protein
VPRRAARAASNERILREVNDRIRDLEESLGTHDEETYRASFLCECYDGNCTAPLSLTLAEYRAARQHPTQFIVLPDHVDPDIERVILRTDRYAIVEKLDADGQPPAH